MTNKMIVFLVAISLTAIGGERAFAQWLPLTAKTSESRTTSKPDGSQVHVTLEGVLYRSSTGDQLEHFRILQDGKLTEEMGSLLDNRQFRVYKIDYLGKTVREMKKLDGAQLPVPPSAEADKKLRQETVDGMACSVFPVVLNGQTIGTLWKSNQYGIPIKSDYTVTDSGNVVHIQAHTYDIQGGHEPDKALFRLDPSFKVLPSLVH